MAEGQLRGKIGFALLITLALVGFLAIYRLVGRPPSVDSLLSDMTAGLSSPGPRGAFDFIQRWRERQREQAYVRILEMGDAAVPDLIRNLRSTDRNRRYSASGLLGSLRSLRATPALIKSVDDPDAMVRMGALSALADIQDARCVPAIVRSSKRSRISQKIDEYPVIRALKTFNTADTRAELRNHIDDDRDVLRCRAIDGLGSVHAKEYLPVLNDLFKHETKNSVRLACIRAICRIDPSRVKDASFHQVVHIIIAKAPPNASRSMEGADAVKTAALMRDAGEVAAITGLVEHGSVPPLQALSALGQIGTPEATAALLRQWQQVHDGTSRYDQADYTKEWIVDALAKTGDRAVLPELRAGLNHASLRLQVRIAGVILKLSDHPELESDALKAARAAVQGSDWQNKLILAIALAAGARDPILVPLLEQLKSDHSEVVRRFASGELRDTELWWKVTKPYRIYKTVITISATEFRARCLELLDRVSQTAQKIQVTKRGVVVAVVTPRRHKSKYAGPGFAKGEMTIVGDIIEPLDLEWEVMK